LRNAKSGMLLYFHRFEGGARPPSAGDAADLKRERFFAFLKDLERTSRATGDAERLLAFHHTVDCGFVLTGRGADFLTLAQPKEESSQLVDLAPTPWDEVLEIVRKGDYEAALRRCRELVKEQPWHRNGYAAGAMLASYLGEHGQGEDLALVGSRYFPKDGALLYYLGLCRLRQGRLEEGERSLQEALEASPELVSARAALAIHFVQTGRYGEAMTLLAARRGVAPDDRRTDADLGVLEQRIRLRAWMLYGGGALALAGVVSTLVVGVPGLAALVLGMFVVGLGWFAFHRQLDSVIERQKFEEISQGLRRLLRRSRATPPIS
jgi:tetratricopeptide (TPR) repeat protein